MRDIYITKTGEIKRDENSIILINENEKIPIPINSIDAIHIFSEVSLNKNLLLFLSKKEINLHFYDHYGNYIGTFYPKDKNLSGTILIEQVNAYQSKFHRMAIAKEICISAAHNILKTLNQYNISFKSIETDMERIYGSSDIQNLMLIEAKIRKEYYSKFNDIIKDNEFTFEFRSKQPPVDKINSLISFGNSLIYNTCLSEIYKTSLDPRISFLHEPFERRFSLNLDISEIFKPLIVDRVIFTLINKKQFKEEDFSAESGGCFLSTSGRKKFLLEYDAKLHQTIKHPTLKRQVSYKGLIRLELYKIIKFLIEGEPYKGFKIYW